MIHRVYCFVSKKNYFFLNSLKKFCFVLLMFCFNINFFFFDFSCRINDDQLTDARWNDWTFLKSNINCFYCDDLICTVLVTRKHTTVIHHQSENRTKKKKKKREITDESRIKSRVLFCSSFVNYRHWWLCRCSTVIQLNNCRKQNTVLMDCLGYSGTVLARRKCKLIISNKHFAFCSNGFNRSAAVIATE